MTIGIYRIINKVNGKSYIGQSIYLEERIKTHFDDADKGYGSAIACAIRKYGKSNFTTEVLYAIDETSCLEETKNVLCQKETEFIAKYETHITQQGYNLTLGGEGPLGVSWSEEAIENHRRVMASPEVRKKISEKTKEAMSRPEVKEKIQGANLGRKWTEERRKSHVENISGSKGRRAKPVKEINSGLLFGCIEHAANCFDLTRETIAYCCKKNRDNQTIDGVLLKRLGSLRFIFISKEEYLSSNSEERDYLESQNECQRA